jgi:cytochrome c-type biogenesis protein CcmH
MRSSLIALACLLWVGSSWATAIDQPLADATQEETARALFRELRCVVCAGQSIAESNATLAAQMRDQVRERVAKGESNAEILARFHAAYGDSILMTPPVKESTFLLWLAPLLLFCTGAALLWRTTRPTKGPTP